MNVLYSGFIFLGVVCVGYYIYSFFGDILSSGIVQKKKATKEKCRPDCECVCGKDD